MRAIAAAMIVLAGAIMVAASELSTRAMRTGPGTLLIVCGGLVFLLELVVGHWSERGSNTDRRDG